MDSFLFNLNVDIEIASFDVDASLFVTVNLKLFVEFENIVTSNTGVFSILKSPS
jgi:hypothetical protein